MGSTEGEWTAGETFSEADTPVTFDYTPATPGAVLYLQVSDASGNASVVQVKVGEDPETAEASIGSAKYETFEQALAAASLWPDHQAAGKCGDGSEPYHRQSP